MADQDPYLPPEATQTPASRRPRGFSGLGPAAVPLAGGLLFFTVYALFMAWGRAWWVLNAPPTAAFRGGGVWDLALAVIYFVAALVFGTTFVLFRQRAALFRPMYVASCLAGMLLLFLVGTQPHSWNALTSPTAGSWYALGIAGAWSAAWIPWLYASARARGAFRN
ncbi:MAG: hypothetical protein ACOY82_05770 [Pseudomonadota bacterium]